MASEPIYLTMMRQERMVVMDLVEDDPIVPPGKIQVETSMLTKVGEELARLITLTNAGTPRSSAGSPMPMSQLVHQLSDLQQLGRFIYEYLFPPLIRQRLTSAEYTDLFLCLDEQLVRVPWELAFDGQDFLLSRFRIGRQVLSHHRQVPEQPAVPNQGFGALKMLIIADPTEQLPMALEEAEHLGDLLAPRTNLDVSIMRGQQLRKPDLLRALPEYDLVHYTGYATFDAMIPSRSGWVLQDDVLTTGELSRMNALPFLVFSNVSEDSTLASRQMPTAYNGKAFGMGHAFLQAGLRNYLGTFCATHDTHGMAFAADFYQHFLQGEPIGSALALARQRSRQQAERHGASYLHYGNPAFRIMPPPTRDKPPPASEPMIEELLREIREREALLQQKFAREVTILFTDITGSTSYFKQYGDLSGRLMVQRHNDLLFPLIPAHQGTLLRTIGDAILAIFDQPINAVEAAIDMQRLLREANQGQEAAKQILIRIGINTGQALIDSHDVYGDAVNVAARVESHALPEQILISEATYQRLPDAIPCRSMGAVEFKGKALPAELYEVLWNESKP